MSDLKALNQSKDNNKINFTDDQAIAIDGIIEFIAEPYKSTAHVIGLTGAKDSKLSEMADVTIRSSQTRTYMIQEHHLPIYHCLCLMLEDRFFGE